MKLGYNDVLRLIPHRHPFIMVDYAYDVSPGESCVGVKHISLNDSVFMGHFENDPIFPGVLIVEGMAQTACLIVAKQFEESEKNKIDEVCENNNYENKIKKRERNDDETNRKQNSVYFMTIDGVKFRKPVRPGDSIEFFVKKVQTRLNVWKFSGIAKVKNEIVAEANFMAMLEI